MNTRKANTSNRISLQHIHQKQQQQLQCQRAFHACSFVPAHFVVHEPAIVLWCVRVVLLTSNKHTHITHARTHAHSESESGFLSSVCAKLVYTSCRHITDTSYTPFGFVQFLCNRQHLNINTQSHSVACAHVKYIYVRNQWKCKTTPSKTRRICVFPLLFIVWH